MIKLCRPLGLKYLVMTLITLVILTAMLASMVWSRMVLLQNGTEVMLKSAPVDPRALLRGYYARLSFNISRLRLHELPQQDMSIISGGFPRRSIVYVKLQKLPSGFWEPLSVHRERPNGLKSNQLFIRGRIISQYCPVQSARDRHYICRLNLHYGIEKFFASKKRATRLEKLMRMRNRTISETELMDRKIRALTDIIDKSRRRLPPGTPPSRKILMLEKKRLELIKRRISVQNAPERNNKGFAVLVRVSRTTGEAAISGLLIDGKRIYEESLF